MKHTHIAATRFPHGKEYVNAGDPLTPATAQEAALYESLGLITKATADTPDRQARPSAVQDETVQFPRTPEDDADAAEHVEPEVTEVQRRRGRPRKSEA